jgi:hypothetical protein
MLPNACTKNPSDLQNASCELEKFNVKIILHLGLVTNPQIEARAAYSQLRLTDNLNVTVQLIIEFSAVRS